MTRYQIVEIGKIADVKGGKRLPKGVSLQTTPNTHPYIRVRDFGPRTLELNEQYEYVDDDTQKQISQYTVSNGDVILSIVGTIGLTAIVGASLHKANLTENCVKITGLDEVDSTYLYYFLSSTSGQELIRTRTVGAVQAKLPIKNIRSIPIPFPERDYRVSVVHVLDTIDSAIAVNQRTNDYLAAMCDAVFAERFGTIEDNATLSDVADITMGQSPSGKSYNEEGNGTVFYQGRGEFGWRFPTQRLFTTEPKRMATEGDVLMSVRAPVGDLNVAYEDCCIGRGLAAIHSQYPSFCLYLMRSLGKKLDAYNGEGTVFGSINGKALNGLGIGLPDDNAIEAFEAFAQSIDQQIRANITEERNLAALRDALLPKLMSGEIDISQVEIPTQPNNHLSLS